LYVTGGGGGGGGGSGGGGLAQEKISIVNIPMTLKYFILLAIYAKYSHILNIVKLFLLRVLKKSSNHEKIVVVELALQI